MDKLTLKSTISKSVDVPSMTVRLVAQIRAEELGINFYVDEIEAPFRDEATLEQTLSNQVDEYLVLNQGKLFQDIKVKLPGMFSGYSLVFLNQEMNDVTDSI